MHGRLLATAAGGDPWSVHEGVAYDDLGQIMNDGELNCASEVDGLAGESVKAEGGCCNVPRVLGGPLSPLSISQGIPSTYLL
jgi:hypothetical protein